MFCRWFLLLALVAACSDAPGEDPDGNPSGQPDAAAPRKRVFITSLRYPADLQSAGLGVDGLDGADRICQTLADAVSLGGTWTAWLSSSTVNAIARITADGPWYGMDGTLLFHNRANLQTVPLAGITYDEQLGVPDPYYEVWTGTAVGGGMRPLGGMTSTTCYDWTSTIDSETVKGELGWEQHADMQWTAYGLGYCSPFQRHLYCFEQ